MAPNEPSATGDVAATQAGGKASVLEADPGSVPADAKSGAKLGAFHKVISRTSPVFPPKLGWYVRKNAAARRLLIAYHGFSTSS